MLQVVATACVSRLRASLRWIPVDEQIARRAGGAEPHLGAGLLAPRAAVVQPLRRGQAGRRRLRPADWRLVDRRTGWGEDRACRADRPEHRAGWWPSHWAWAGTRWPGRGLV